jgi:hypothetical protein
MHRAVVPGGRLAVSTWRFDDEIPFFREVRLIAERHLTYRGSASQFWRRGMRVVHRRPWTSALRK